MSTITLSYVWAELSRGRALAQAAQRAQNAANRPDLPDQQCELLDDPHAADLLRRMGFQIEDNAAPWATVRHIWRRDYWYTMFVGKLAEVIAELVTTTGNDDGSVTQTVPTEAAVALWERLYGEYFGPDSVSAHSREQGLTPCPEDAPAHIAAALAELPGPAWSSLPDGSAAIRRLPAQPLRYAPLGALQPLKLELKNRMLLDVVCWVYLPKETRINPNIEHELVYLSLLGPQKKIKAGWAALMDSKRELLKLPVAPRHHYHGVTYINARRIEGKGMYQAFWNDEPLPESGLAHVVIQHARMLRPRTAQPFLHVTGEDGTPDLRLFFAQLCIALTIPLAAPPAGTLDQLAADRSWLEEQFDPELAATLWDAGLKARLIARLPSHGCTGYWVDAGDEAAWGTIIARQAGATNVTIESFGIAQDDTPQVAMVVSEADEDE